jgi:polar amino acid transport system permease protein
MDFNLKIFLETLPLLVRGAGITILLTVISSAIGIVIGFFMAQCRVARGAVPRAVASAYVMFFRTMPLLLTLTLLYFGLPSLGINIEAVPVAIMGLSVTFGAYATEIIRSGIESVSPAQIRAARAIGLSHFQAMRWVVLPQAMRRVLAPLSNEVLATLKQTSLVSTIAIADLLRVGVETMSWRANTFSPLLGVALGYFLLALPLMGLNKWLEKRIRVT